MATPAAKPAAPPAVVGMSKQGLQTVKEMLDQYRNAIQAALPKHMNVDRMSRIAITSVQKNPKLLECAPITLIGAVIQLAQLGLEPDDGTGKAYLIPFFNGKKSRFEVQAMAGFKGLVHLARNSGEIRTVIPRAVHANDHFVYDFGTNRIEHRPTDGEPGALKYVYAVAYYKDGSDVSFDVMTLAQVEEIRDMVRKKNKGRDSQVWADHFEEMAKKTVVRRLCKHLPSSPELQKAVTMDEKADYNIPQDLGKIVLPDSEKSSEELEEPEAPKRLSDGEKTAAAVISDTEVKHLQELSTKHELPPHVLDEYLKETYKVIEIKNLPKELYAPVCQWIENEPEIPLGK